MDKIILASSSPRRQEILTQAGIKFETVPSDIDEDLHIKVKPDYLVKELSHKKAEYVAKARDNVLVIGADTVVVIDSEIIGKPCDEREAFLTLKKLIGKKHLVYTGVTLIKKNGGEIIKKSFIDKAEVFMKPVGDEDLLSYIKTGEPMDKAGAYAIQGRGCLFVEKIRGDFYTVMGLPISRVYWEIKAMGLEL